MLQRNSTRGRFTNSISGRIGRLFPSSLAEISSVDVVGSFL